MITFGFGDITVRMESVTGDNLMLAVEMIVAFAKTIIPNVASKITVEPGDSRSDLTDDNRRLTYFFHGITVRMESVTGDNLMPYMVVTREIVAFAIAAYAKEIMSSLTSKITVEQRQSYARDSCFCDSCLCEGNNV